ncbi:hypothetical protein BDB01DRAFT_457975 [Pilobolus umbonatus]|nr:hypothetical protein BDB01DRAFT_457975 [Pilobolus umbonatus]
MVYLPWIISRYPLRNEVDNSNRRRLEALTGEAVKFRAIDKGDMKSCIAPTEIELKLHAQVMLLKNIDADLVNGSLGVVVGFVGSGKYTTKQSVEYLRAPNKINGSYKMAGEKDDGIDMTKPFPIVKFSDGRLLVLEYESWSIELPGR